MPAVTVIIPSYNHAAFLSDCIKSIQAQSFTDWEIILIDDGSTDNSVEIAKELARSDSRIRVQQNGKNLGTYGTQARGLSQSESRYIAIMNSDDTWHPSKLKSQIEVLGQHPTAVLCYCLGWMIDQDGNETQSEDVHNPWSTDQHQRPHQLLFENRILASGVLWRRDHARFEPSLRYSGDWVALLEASTRGDFICLPDRLTFWRQHETNSYKLSAKQAAEEICVRLAIESNYAALAGHLTDTDAAMARAQNLLNLGALQALFYDIRGARASLITGLRIGSLRRPLLRRLISSFLPIQSFRRHLWRENADLVNLTDNQLLAQARQQRPIRL